MLQIYCDGGSRGNPGRSAYGFVVIENTKQIYAESGFLGINTNNFAEYTALIKALGWLVKNQIKQAQINMDSELVVKQMNGFYKVKNVKIKALYEEAKMLSSSLNVVKYTHILRHLNKAADALVNIELDKHEIY